ncbi:MAG TPA: hypothetical protein VNW97_23065 [Candidatus Saccharimonadales bacterium]|nr:hypothetical protein [Candidatus Saccharimonadales bacterium]
MKPFIQVRRLLVALLAVPLSVSASAGADSARHEPLQEQQRLLTAQTPIDVEDNFLQGMGAQTRSEASSKMSAAARAAMQQNNLLTVPHFSGSFSYQGRPFPFLMVGGDPHQSATTTIKTQIIPISMSFEGYDDNNGDPMVLDVAPALEPFRNSPNFRPSSYGTGFTQLGDAVQRAEFFHAMDPDWHTMLEPPRPLAGVTVDVPRGLATLYRNRRTGVVFAVVDEGFFISHLNTILQLQNLDPAALTIALTSNVFLAQEGDIRQCCTVGFHTAFDAGLQGGRQVVQTFVWSSWVEPGIFGPNFADVTAASHEISEWINDPFGSNLAPSWQYPNGAGGCQDNLETGDPLEGFPNLSYSVTIGRRTYHPQSAALLQWFSREKPSSAFDGVYSFPNPSLLTAPSEACAKK